MNHDYDCKECGNPVLFRSDHKPTCVHYPSWLVLGTHLVTNP